MKITIDTKEDSHEEIKNIIAMLSSLVGQEPVSNQPGLFEPAASEPAESGNDESPEVPASSSDGMFNMFGDTIQPQEVPDTKVEEELEADEYDLGIPKIEEYED